MMVLLQERDQDKREQITAKIGNQPNAKIDKLLLIAKIGKYVKPRRLKLANIRFSVYREDRQIHSIGFSAVIYCLRQQVLPRQRSHGV